MAKKLNKKVAIIGILLIVLIIGGGILIVIRPRIARSRIGHTKIARILGFGQNPDKALEKAKEFLDAGDYLKAEEQFGISYSFGETDAYKVERLFDIANFHLINNQEHEVNWLKALGCWSKITNIDSNNIEARRNMLDYYYQSAEAGNPRLWKNIKEITEEMLDILNVQGTEPDAELLTTCAKANLYMAQRGETTNRKELLNESLARLEDLLKQYPEKEDLYQLRAQAAMIQGELNEMDGIRNAKENAQQDAVQWLNTGFDQADDKATAAANLLKFRLQTAVNEPNEVDNIRSEIEIFADKIEPNAEFLFVTSIAYENPGNLSPMAELNQAIEAIRQARELAPENIEYTIRMAQLLYQKGSAFDDSDAVSDAIQITEDALTKPGTQDIPGPRQGQNLAYRYFINMFLSDVYIEKALQANNSKNEPAAQEWIRKAQERIDEITSYLGTTENPTVQKFQGMLALANGQEDKAVRLMYQAYQQSKALDKAQERSQIDPVLCLMLADVMKNRAELGMRLEFLGKAISNQNPIVLRKPWLLLDYAEILTQLRAWPVVLAVVDTYQGRYGTNLRSQTLKTQVLIGLIGSNEVDKTQQALAVEKAKQALSEIPENEPIRLKLNLGLLNSQITQIRRSIGQQEDPDDPSAEQTEQLTQLRTERSQLLGDLLDQNPDMLDSGLLTSICYDLIQSNQTQIAVEFVDQYLSEYPDNTPLRVLKLQMQEENPVLASRQRLQELKLQVLKALPDSNNKSLELAKLYREQDDYVKAVNILQEIPKENADKDSQVLGLQFELAMAQEDFQTAESLLKPIRELNLDGCEGSVYSARIELAKENYQLALRRLEESQRLQPLSSEIYSLKGAVYHQLEDYNLAIENLQAAITMDPKNSYYARNMAATMFARNTKLSSNVTPQQEDEVQKAIERAMATNPSDWQLRSFYAESISSDNPDEALSIRQNLLKAKPNATNALMLGNMAIRIARSEWDTAKKSGLVELAASAYQQAIQLEPENETAQQVYADFLLRSGKGQEATELLKDDQNLLWKYYLRNSQFEQAKEILEGLHETDPEDTLVLRGLILATEGLGNNRLQLKQYLDLLKELVDSKDSELFLLQKYLDNAFTTEVEERLEGFKKRYPEETVALLLEGWIQMGNGNLEEAISLTNRYLETETENAGAWRLRGRLHHLMNQPQKAIADLQRSKRIQPNPNVRIELASVYKELGNPQGAIGELKEGLEDPQAPIKLWSMLESTYMEMGEFAELEKFYLATLKKYPESIFWLQKTGEYYLAAKNYAKAQQLLQNAWKLSVQRNNKSVDLLIACLKCLYEGGQYEQAFSFASGFIDTPVASVAYTYIALVQLKLNQPEKAEVSFGKALQKAETNEQMQELVLQNMMKTVGPKPIESWCRKELSQNPSSLSAHLFAYLLAQREGRYNNAAEHLDRCMEQLGEEDPIWLSLAIKKSNVLLLAYSKTADKNYLDRSVSLLETILERQPDNYSLLNNLAYLLIDNDQQIEAALGYARKALQGDPSNAVHLDTYAYGLCKTEQYKEAERNLLRAIQISEASGTPIPWDMFKHMAMAYEGLGKTSEAREAYQKAIEAAGDIPEKEKNKLQQAVERLDI